MAAYYNEHDQFAAGWLRELIKAGLIAPGEVDERSIEDVTPAELSGFTQCHFFAGIGVWSWALRRAGWSDDRPVWTGSCPCQPFSAAGKGDGFADERHLWPAFHYLISACRPVTVFGEQVASADGLAWYDLVRSDLEGTGYACGEVDTCAAGFGAHHIRQRLYWVADSGECECGTGSRGYFGEAGAGCEVRHDADGCCGVVPGREGEERAAVPGRVGNPKSKRLEKCIWIGRVPCETEGPGKGKAAFGRGLHPRSFWADCEWLPCRDGKARPVEPGTFPLAHGAPARVGRLRGYGNAIVAPQAEAFVKAFMDLREPRALPLLGVGVGVDSIGPALTRTCRESMP